MKLMVLDFIFIFVLVSNFVPPTNPQNRVLSELFILCGKFIKLHPLIFCYSPKSCSILIDKKKKGKMKANKNKKKIQKFDKKNFPIKIFFYFIPF